MDASQARDVCEALLIEKARLQREDPKNDDIDEWQVIQNLLELFVGGTETATSTLSFAMFYMAAYPGVQEKLHAEIDAVVGSSREPGMKGCTTMPACGKAQRSFVRSVS